jgi:hypothetical protein
LPTDSGIILECKTAVLSEICVAFLNILPVSSQIYIPFELSKFLFLSFLFFFFFFWKQRGQEATCINGTKYTPGPRERVDPIRASRGREEREPEKQLAIIYIVNDEATTRRPLSPYDPVSASVTENAPRHPRSIEAFDQLLFFPRVTLDLLSDSFPR